MQGKKVSAKKKARNVPPGLGHLRAEIPGSLYRQLRLILLARDETVRVWITRCMEEEVARGTPKRRP